MPADVDIPARVLSGFLLAMTRMGGLMLFVPMPGLRTGPGVARILFSAMGALMLAPVWSRVARPYSTPALFFGAMLGEALLGIAIGLLVGFLSESFIMAAQMMSLQAGYSYASTIDPNTEAEAGFLVVVAQLLAGMLFFCFGIDREVLAALGQSFARIPPGAVNFTPADVEALTRAAASIFTVGLRLALPVMTLLAMADITLALVGRLNAQLQVTSIAFPAKMMATLGLLGWIAIMMPAVFNQSARQFLAVVHRLLGM